MMLDQMGTESIFNLMKIQENKIIYPFNLSGLYKLHADIFKNYSQTKLDTYRPLQIRSEVPYMQVWSKDRNIPGWGISTVIYSSMNDDIQKETELFLEKTVDIEKFKRMKHSQLANIIGSIYISLDYLHSFYDGNSRTIREFTRQICYQAGYDLLWENCNKTIATRNELCLARDFAVNNMALKHTEIPELQYDIRQYIEKQKGNKPLWKIVKENLRAIRQNVQKR